MIWGQTGTRHGATQRQIASVGWLWGKYGIDRLHDGDCIGADEQLFYLAKAFGIAVTLHPPIIEKNRAWCGQWDLKTTILPAKAYFVRDRDVVDDAKVMVATPLKLYEQDRGGTWYTVRYTRKTSKPLAIVWPNGHITYERWNLEQL